MPNSPQSAGAVEIFCSYAHKDETLRNELAGHLSPLQRAGKIKSWYDRDIKPGEDWKGKIDEHLNSAHVILLLVSSDFIRSDYCYDIEMARAMERHKAGEARIVAVILRPCDWQRTQFADLQVLPVGAKPVTRWADLDEALLNAAQGIGAVVEELLAKPAGVAAVAAPTSTTSAPPLVSLPRPPVVGFIARRDTEGHDILARLKEELAPERAQIVALSGPGGTGKTTLAAQTARELSEKFPQCIAWVSALARADFTLSMLLDEIAAQFGRADLRPLALEQKEAQVRAVLAAAPALVVLDNFETVAPKEQARCLDFLAERAACSALITTRGDTKRGDVGSVALAAMEMDEAREFVRRLIWQTRKPKHFAGLDTDDLIGKCEANPLVLQWVVKQIELAHQPQTALDYLAQGKGDAAKRVFDRSFNLPQVGDDGRAALLALTLFVPSATRAALAEVAGFDDDLPRLERAVENLSALWLVETTAGNERLILRGLTRELAKARLRQDTHVDEYRCRFVAYFLHLAEAHAKTIPEDLDAQDVERDNLLSAIDMAFELQDWQSGLRLADISVNSNFGGLLYRRGYWDEAVRRGEQALKAAEAANSEWYIGSFANTLGMLLSLQGDFSSARKHYEQAVGIARKLGAEQGLSATLHELGRLAQAQGVLDEARRLYNESLEIAKRLGDQRGIADTLHQLGRLAQAQGEFVEAQRLYNENLQIHQKLGDQIGIASTLHNLAAIAQALNELGEARRLYDESLQINQKLGNQSGIAITLHQLGRLAQTEGDRAEAARLLREALSIFERLKSPYAEMARRHLARVEGGIEAG